MRQEHEQAGHQPAESAYAVQDATHQGHDGDRLTLPGLDAGGVAAGGSGRLLPGGRCRAKTVANGCQSVVPSAST